MGRSVKIRGRYPIDSTVGQGFSRDSRDFTRSLTGERPSSGFPEHADVRSSPNRNAYTVSTLPRSAAVLERNSEGISDVKLNINGQSHELDVAPGMPLLWVLRDKLRLTGTKFGCGIAQCGACTVQIDGQARRSCVTPAESVEGADIRTIEGLEGQAADAVQSAWIALDVPQCGYCQSGQIMSAVALLEQNASPSEEDIEGAMAGNLCRCNCYVRIRQAVRDAAETKGGA
jgi:isoquinoline 1-oxidoreductase alpha subunit